MVHVTSRRFSHPRLTSPSHPTHPPRFRRPLYQYDKRLTLLPIDPPALLSPSTACRPRNLLAKTRQFTRSYASLTTPNMSLQATLDNTIKAVSNRAAEGQRLFSPIASLLDNHLRLSSNLSPHLLGALSSLSLNLSAVA
jgi:hypothetical protein